MDENDASTPHLILLDAIDAAYTNRTGKKLGADCCPAEIERGGKWARLAWVDNSAPFGLLAHNTDSDPKFIYANDAAIRMFGYRRDELIGLPSRLSASQDRRAARAAFLDLVREQGIAENYADIRVDRSGHPFKIRDGTVWQFNDSDGAVVGQAALIWFDGKTD